MEKLITDNLYGFVELFFIIGAIYYFLDVSTNLKTYLILFVLIFLDNLLIVHFFTNKNIEINIMIFIIF